ncbi:hypothetical protein SADUNF_Sadunf11G0071600 [Salix dunnii]|uniref:Uncharacterized protein n=1 Tax=Salix dunnii TaxID=1413687 RepID=A0A835JMZ1_9ROSI|nr:hypothetical protein SADUNF_Sadunf11G0071600 [Salix dunnii]
MVRGYRFASLLQNRFRDALPAGVGCLSGVGLAFICRASTQALVAGPSAGRPGCPRFRKPEAEMRAKAWSAIVVIAEGQSSVLVHRTVVLQPPSLSAQGPTGLAARRGSCVAYPLRWNSNVKVSLFASFLPGGAGQTRQCARAPVERTLAELDHVRSLVLSDAEREAGARASALSTAFSSCLCSIRLTSSPVSA